MLGMVVGTSGRSAMRLRRRRPSPRSSASGSSSMRLADFRRRMEMLRAGAPEMLHRGEHQRLGQMRNGASKRRMDEADNSLEQGAPPPPLRARPEAEDVPM